MDQLPARPDQEPEDSVQASQPVPIELVQAADAAPNDDTTVPEPLPPVKPARRKWPWIVGGVVLLLVLIVAGALFAINYLANANFASGTTSLNQGNFAQAILDFDMAINLKPGFAEAFAQRGTAKAAAKDLTGAKADFDKAIALMPAQ